MRRCLKIHVETCGRCRGKMRLVALVKAPLPQVVRNQEPEKFHGLPSPAFATTVTTTWLFALKSDPMASLAPILRRAGAASCTSRCLDALALMVGRKGSLRGGRQRWRELPCLRMCPRLIIPS